MVSVVRCSHAQTTEEVEDYRKAHTALFGSCADVPTFLKDPNDANLYAVVGQVHDLEELRRISRTPEGDALMRKNGFLEQLTYFVEEA